MARIRILSIIAVTLLCAALAFGFAGPPGQNAAPSSSSGGNLGDVTAGGANGTLNNFSVNNVLNPLSPQFNGSNSTDTFSGTSTASGIAGTVPATHKRPIPLRADMGLNCVAPFHSRASC
jgi:hypothetical protein